MKLLKRALAISIPLLLLLIVIVVTAFLRMKEYNERNPKLVFVATVPCNFDNLDADWKQWALDQLKTDEFCWWWHFIETESSDYLLVDWLGIEENIPTYKDCQYI